MALGMTVLAQELILLTWTDRRGINELSAVHHDKCLATKLSQAGTAFFELFLGDLHVLT